MGRTTFSGPIKSTNGFECGSTGTQLTLIQKGTVAVDPASLATVTAADTTVTITGVATGDLIVMNPPTAGLTAGLLVCGVWASAADTVTIRLYNSTGSTIDEASASWTYAIFRS